MTQYVNDCSALTAWSEVGLVAGTQYSAGSGVITSSASGTAEILKHTATSADASADIEVLARFKATTSATASRIAIIRGAGTTTATLNGYYVDFTSTGLQTRYLTNGSPTQISTYSKTFTSGVYYWVRFRVNGTAIQAKAWDNVTEQEPSSWQCDSTNSSYSSGYTGLYCAATAASDTWDHYAAASAGEWAYVGSGINWGLNLGSSNPERIYLPSNTYQTGPNKGIAFDGVMQTMSRASKTVSGTTKSGGAAVGRRVVLLNQDDPSYVVDKQFTQNPNNAFAFVGLKPGNYIVIDLAPTNAERALVYDWVVAG